MQQTNQRKTEESMYERIKALINGRIEIRG